MLDDLTEAEGKALLDQANVLMASESASVVEKRRFPLLATYELALKCSNLFNLLDARGVISVTERQSYILRVRELAKACGEAWVHTEAGRAA